jgi:hypothetical protein
MDSLVTLKFRSLLYGHNSISKSLLKSHSIFHLAKITSIYWYIPTDDANQPLDITDTWDISFASFFFHAAIS